LLKKLRGHGTFWVVAAFVSLGFLIYSNTFQVSPRFDDSIFIFDRIQIRDLHRIWTEGDLYRKIPYLTFALNYQWTGQSVWSWHLVNLLLHILTTCFVYGIARTAWRSPVLKGTALAAHGGTLSVLTGLVFLCHPIQTSSVTYIYQRMIVIATLFHAITLYSYLRARIDGGVRFWFLCAAGAGLAVFTKQVNMTLPLTLLLTEAAFCAVSFRAFFKRGMFFLPLIVLPGVLYVRIMNFDLTRISLDALKKLYPLNLNSHLSWTEWVLTQMNVMRTYLRLMIFPMNQTLDYDYPISRSWAEPGVIASSAVLVAVLFGALVLWRRMRIISWGILFMASVLVLEFFAIRDTIFEHRLYLPMLGFAIAAPAALFAIIAAPRRALAIACVLITGLSAAAYARNGVWADEEKFWKEGIRMSPNRGRPYYSLGVYYAMKGEHAKAVPLYRRAIEIWPRYADAYSNLGKSLEETGQMDQAILYYAKALQLDPTLPEALNNFGSALVRAGRQEEARGVYEEAIRRKPDNYEAMSNLGSAHAQLSQWKEAEEWYRKAIATNPLHAPAHSNLASIQSRNGDEEGALKSCLEAVRLDPNYFEARYNLALLHVKRGRWSEAEEQYRHAVRIRPDFTDGHSNLGTFAAKRGDFAAAEKFFRRGLELDPDHREVAVNLVNALMSQGRIDEAASLLGPLKARWPDDLRVLKAVRALDAWADSRRPNRPKPE
jgi:tetratricopeptide (TPR) repeat protein